MYHYPFLTTFNFVVHSVFFGFCLWSFLWVFRRGKEWRFYFSVDEIDKVIVKTVIAATIGNLLIICYEVMVAWYSGVEYKSYALIHSVTGPYWLLFWTNTFIYYILPFLFLSDKIRNAKLFRIITLLLFLAILNFERIVILITSLHRDYIPSSWTMYGPDPFLIHLSYVATFIALIAVILIIKKSKNNKPPVPD
jgi:molybdopterin-containing oxidoreductase family membrane subunit